MRVGRFVLLAVLALGPAPAVADTDRFDLHWFWEQRCQECHGHAGPFARQALTVVDGRLVGRHHGGDLRAFLANHRVPADLVAPVYGMLLAQAGTNPRFQEKCGGCHETAAGLVRDSLELRDGVLVGRDSGRPVATFLTRHGRLAPDEVPFFTDLLTRIAGEVNSPLDRPSR